MQTRWSQEPVARKGREGASPSRRTHGTHPTGVGGSLQSCYGGVRFPGGPLWRVNGSGRPASLLTSAHRRCGIRVLRSPHMEDEPVRVPASSGTRTGAQALSFERSVLRNGLLPHPLATTQPVDGARLISGYGAVRLRGGQLGASSPVGVLVL
jgi:hypothetical protein